MNLPTDYKEIKEVYVQTKRPKENYKCVQIYMLWGS